jgi:polyisoprenoid-binding protein YceI
MNSQVLRTIVILAVLASPLAIHGQAQGDTWMADTAHSYVGFKVRHMALAWVRGEFETFEVRVQYDGKKINKASVEATIDAASIQTRNAKRDEHLRSDDFFDATAFPKLSFRSTKIKVRDDGSFELIGDLTIRDVTRQVTLSMEGSLEPIQDPWGNVKLGFSASGSINRQDFGVSWNKLLDGGGLVVGDTVHLVIDVELNRAK